MKLKSIRIKGYKSFKDSLVIPFHNLTVFIGENDSGKTSILNALEILLLNKQLFEGDFHTNSENNTISDLIEIDSVFDVPETLESLHDYIINYELNLIKRVSKIHGVKFFAKKNVYVDDRFNRIDKLSVQELKNIAEELGLEKNKLKIELKSDITEFIKTNHKEKEIQECEIQWKDIVDFLPIYQRYNSSDYGNPQSLVGKVLQNIYRSHFYTTKEDGKEVLNNHFVKLKSNIEKNLNSKIQESLKSKIQQYNANVKDVQGSFNIDFANGLDFYQLKIDTGGGLTPINNRGEGAKKRMQLAILEWDKELEKEIISQRGIIKAYDEPDANLHFEAQRKLFYEITKENSNSQLNQAIICTHSITMIDRAPSHNINRLVVNEFEQSEISYLLTNNDSDVKEFLNQLSEMGGIKNSSIFYERCFLLVEGESEENAIPILYKKFKNKTISEDGVVIINLQSNGAWQNFLKLLNKNKQSCTLLLLDSDTQNPESKAKVTPKRLLDIGFDSHFLSNNVVFVGVKEFEDIYPDNILVSMLNNRYPKNNQTLWTESEISLLKSSSLKFSKDISIEIGKQHGEYIGKPEIALSFANHISDSDINQMDKIIALFEKIEKIIQ